MPHYNLFNAYTITFMSVVRADYLALINQFMCQLINQSINQLREEEDQVSCSWVSSLDYSPLCRVDVSLDFKLEQPIVTVLVHLILGSHVGETLL